MEGDEELKDICTELDSLSMRMLQLMKEYIDVKITLEDVMKIGNLNLAKSRYIMGNRSVSVLQLPTEDSQLEATVKVVSNEEIDGITLALNKIDLKDNKPDIKHRKTKAQVNEKGDKKSDDESDEEKEFPNKTVMQDPIKWFGVLIPQNLRQAQAGFSKALEYSIQCVNLQLEMSSILDSHKQLIAKKKIILGKKNKAEESSS